MFTYVEPPNEKAVILTKILKIFCVLILIIGLFKLSSQKLDTYYYCLANEVINVSIIFTLLQEVHEL